MKLHPTHKHDCDACTFIGATVNDRGRITDWYTCGKTLLGRRSNDGPDYVSYDVNGMHVEPTLGPRDSLAHWEDAIVGTFILRNAQAQGLIP